MSDDAFFVLGAMVGAIALPMATLLLLPLHVEVQEGHVILVTRFGRLAATLARPGWHWLPDRVLPWVGLHRLSLRRQFRHIEEVAINDRNGTTVIADIWVELRVVDPVKAAFAVDDWDAALRHLVAHTAGSVLSTDTFDDILHARAELGQRLAGEIGPEMQRWGVQVDAVLLQRLSLLPEVQEQLLASVAAKLLRAKADIDEAGRQRVRLLDAMTEERTAALVAQAKVQYPTAVGRAYARLGDTPEVLHAYQQLYELAQIRPHRATVFRGITDADLRKGEAMMFVPNGEGGYALAQGPQTVAGGHAMPELTARP
ncbi:MAG: SPFH domain-containing protein [Deltaproteobacteria bacterium]|nr:SPFH domain-containing protein [Deltaproteobacteria bacterium]